MEGVVLGYESEEGVIKASDGSRYAFKAADWKSSRPPVAGLKVDFIPEDNHAKEVYAIPPALGAIIGASSILNPERSIPMVVYICYLAGFLYGLTMIVGVIIAYVYRNSSDDEVDRSHFEYQISIFWKSLVGFVLGCVLTVVLGLGVIILIGTYVWVILKIVKGWRLLSEGKQVMK